MTPSQTSSCEPITIGLVYGHSLNFGGVENHMLSIVRLLDRSRFRWRLFAPASEKFTGQMQALGVEVILWEQSHTFDLPAFYRLLNLLRAYPVDLIHIHNPFSAILGRVVARFIKLPVIVTIHLTTYSGIPTSTWRSRIRRRLFIAFETFTNRWMKDTLIFVSNQLRDEALALGVIRAGQAMVIENGVDLRPYQNPPSQAILREKIGEMQDAIVICAVGRLAEQKGIDLLLKAIGQLPQSDQKILVWLVGDGPLRPDLEQMAVDLKIANQVKFLGFRDDVAQLLLASDIFGLASRYEALPLVLIEALAAGLPCVVTDVGENARMVKTGENGWVVPLENSEAIATALGSLIRNPDLRRKMGEISRERSKQYSDMEMTTRLVKVYNSVCQSSKKRA
jgi:glycosyltransferase involved in cell wall biosynthesis